MSRLYHLPSLSIVDVRGADADAILHNVTTNAVKTLARNQGCETFITDVRGKTLGHGYLYRIDSEAADSDPNQTCRFRYVGAAGQSQRIVEHMDKYTIREDAVPEKLDETYQGFVIPAESVQALESAGQFSIGGTHSSSGDTGSDANAGSPSHAVRCWDQTIAGVDASDGDVSEVGVSVYQTEYLGPAALLVLVNAAKADSLLKLLGGHGLTIADEAAFHQARVVAGFPWYGIDLDEKNLPQEADRDSRAVSFTKGCYLGQETVARLDALGQVQRKLVMWSIQGGTPCPGSTLDHNGKTVGRLTSIANSGNTVSGDVISSGDPAGWIALGYARRSHFEPGAVAEGVDSDAGKSYTASVIGPTVSSGP